MGDLGLGAVVTAPIAMVGIWLKELLCTCRGDPTVLAKPPHEMATVKSIGCNLGGPLPKAGHGEVMKDLVHGHDPGISNKAHSCAGDDEYVQEHI